MFHRMKTSVVAMVLLPVFWGHCAFSLTECQQAIIAASAPTLSRLLASRLTDKFKNAYQAHRATALLLSYLSEDALKEFYSLATISDDTWDDTRAIAAVKKMTEWFPPSDENQPITVGDFTTTIHASYYLQLLGLNERTLTGFPLLRDDLPLWRQLRRFNQIALFDSFFWPDHGLPHVMEILMKVENLSELLTDSQRERYAFLLADNEEGALWRQRMRIAAFLHDIVALNHREAHAYHSNGYAHLVLGEILFDNQYVPLLSPVPNGFWEECAICGLIALLHSKSTISTDELPSFEEILLRRKLEAFGRVFGNGREINLASPVDVGLQMVALPVMSDEDRARVAKAGELLRMLDAHRTRGQSAKRDTLGLINTAGYKFKIKNGKVFLDVSDFPGGARLLPLPSRENYFLYGQLAMRTPNFNEVYGPELKFPLIIGGERFKAKLVTITKSEPFKNLLRTGKATKEEIRGLSSDERVQSVIGTILDIASEYPRTIRDNLTISFE